LFLLRAGTGTVPGRRPELLFFDVVLMFFGGFFVVFLFLLRSGFRRNPGRRPEPYFFNQAGLIFKPGWIDF